MWWCALAWGAPLEEALQVLEKKESSQKDAALERILSSTRAPSALEYPLDTDDQVDLSLRWYALEQQPDCQRFEEMREALRRSKFQIALDPAFATSFDRFGLPRRPFSDRTQARYQEITGVAWPGSYPPREVYLWKDLPSYVVTGGASMQDAAQTCPSKVLLELASELTAAGVADQKASPTSSDPNAMTLGDQLEVEWSALQMWGLGGDIEAAQEKMVALLKRRNGSTEAVRAASRVQKGVDEIRTMWDPCSGHHCSEVLAMLSTVPRADPEKLRLSEPGCRELVDALSPAAQTKLQKLAETRRLDNASLKGELGQLAFGLYGLGCVQGTAARFDPSSLRAHVQALPASCGPAPAPTAELPALIAHARDAVLKGCTPRPWEDPP